MRSHSHKLFIFTIALIAWAFLGIAAIIQKPNCPTEPWPFVTDFWVNPFADGRCWTKQTANITWTGPDADSNPYISSDGAATALQIATLDDPDADGYGQHCVIQWGSNGGSVFDRMGCVFRANNASFSTSKHIVAWVFGGNGGEANVGEFTGAAGDHVWDDFCDVGAVLASEYAGFAIEGSGTSREISFWDFDSSPPSNLTDPDTWGTCDCGLYDDTSGPGCSTDVDADSHSTTTVP